MIRAVELEIEAETGNIASFFASNTVPPRFRSRPYVRKDGSHCMVATIDDVVRWSQTGRRAKGSYLDDPPEGITCVSGFCE